MWLTALLGALLTLHASTPIALLQRGAAPSESSATAPAAVPAADAATPSDADAPPAPAPSAPRDDASGGPAHAPADAPRAAPEGASHDDATAPGEDPSDAAVGSLGAAGSVVTDEESASAATRQLEGDALDPSRAGVRERLPRLEVAGWSTLLASMLSLATAGALAGFTEREENRAFRIAARIDETTGRPSLYADVKDDYQRALDRGYAMQWAARGVLIGGLALMVAGITLVGVSRVRESRLRERVSARAGGLSVHF